MTAMRRMTFEVPEHLAAEIDAEIASGAYDDIGQLVAQSVESRLHPDRYLGHDSLVERWLVEEVGPTYDAYKADPTRLVSEGTAFKMLDDLAAARTSKR